MVAKMGYQTYMYICLVVLTTSIIVQAADKEFTFEGLSAKVLGQSGKIRLWKNGEGGGEPGPALTITMDELKECDDQNIEVGKSGSTKHSFNSFASQTFNFSEFQDGDVPDSEVAATFLTFQSQLSGLSSTLEVSLFLIKEAGTITLNDEETEVKAGQAKFNIKLTDWEWCGCSQGGQTETGAYVDFVMSFQSEGYAEDADEEQTSDEEPKKFSLGGGSQVQLSTQIKVDGTWQDMPSGYPKMENLGSKQLFTVRFPRFTTEVIYDPTLTLGGGNVTTDGGNGVTDGGNGVTRAVLSLLLIAACLLASFHQL